MKKYISIIIAAVVAAASISCQKSEVAPSGNIKFIARSIETKTAFGAKNGSNYPTLWTENDSKVKIALNCTTPKDATVTPSGDFKQATFGVTFPAPESDGSPYTFYALSPASSYVSITSSKWNVNIPTLQTPSATSVDEDAQILVATSTAFDAWPSSVNLDFKHVPAYGKLTLSNLDLGGATFLSLSLTAGVNWAGRWNYYVADADGKHIGDVVENSASKTITINTTSSSDIWFAFAPVDMHGQTLKVTVNTSAGTIEKESVLPETAIFQSGKVYPMTFDMTGLVATTPKVYSLVTDVNDITVDSELIIACPTKGKAISVTQNDNNRAAVATTISENAITDPSDGVQVFLAKRGNIANTLSFYDADYKSSEDWTGGYLYAGSSSKNYLRTQRNIDGNASFSVSIDNSGIATLIAQGSNTNNRIRYNDYNGADLFSCYGSDYQNAVAIYKLGDTGTSTKIFMPVLPNPEILAAGDNNNKKVSVTWSDVANATSYTVSCTAHTNPENSPASQTIGTGVEFAEFNVAEYDTYTVKVTATADDRFPGAASSDVIISNPNILAAPEILVEGYSESKTVYITWSDVANATTYTVDCGDKTQNIAAGVEEATFIMDTYGTFDVTVTAKADGYISGVSDTKSVVLLQPGLVKKTMTVDFENSASSYTNFAFTNMESSLSAITAHGGSKHGTTGGKTTASVKTNSKLAAPQKLTCYVSKSSSNTTASTWYIQVSTDGSNWTDVSNRSASSMSKGSWVEFSADLTAYSNVYVRIYYSGTTAVRCIDDLSIEYLDSE